MANIIDLISMVE